MPIYAGTAALRVSGKEPKMHHVSCPDLTCWEECVDEFNAMRGKMRDWLKAHPHDPSDSEQAEVLIRGVCDKRFFHREDAGNDMLSAGAVKHLEGLWNAFVSSTPCTTHSCDCP